MDTVDKVVCQLAQEDTDYWLIVYEGRMVGGVRVVRKKDANLISPMFVLPEEQNKGIGSAVLEQLFQMYPETFCWRLVTIQEERGIVIFMKRWGSVILCLPGRCRGI